MSTKHTESPWRVSVTGQQQALIISEATGANVAVVYDKKDAGLIALAPQLKSVLGRLLCCPDLCLDELEQETREAIAEAETLYAQATEGEE